MKALWLALVLTGCATETIYVVKPLSIIPRPELQYINHKDFDCLSQDTKDRLHANIRTLKDYAVRLETIIKSTHTQKEAP